MWGKWDKATPSTLSREASGQPCSWYCPCPLLMVHTGHPQLPGVTLMPTHPSSDQFLGVFNRVFGQGGPGTLHGLNMTSWAGNGTHLQSKVQYSGLALRGERTGHRLATALHLWYVPPTCTRAPRTSSWSKSHMCEIPASHQRFPWSPPGPAFGGCRQDAAKGT